MWLANWLFVLFRGASVARTWSKHWKQSGLNCRSGDLMTDIRMMLLSENLTREDGSWGMRRNSSKTQILSHEISQRCVNLTQTTADVLSFTRHILLQYHVSVVIHSFLFWCLSAPCSCNVSSHILPCPKYGRYIDRYIDIDRYEMSQKLSRYVDIESISIDMDEKYRFWHIPNGHIAMASLW